MSAFVGNTVVGWSLLLSGVVFVLSFVFLALMFSTKRSPWGPLNDVSYVIALLLITPILISFYLYLRPINPIASLIAVCLSITGILIITITQWRLVMRTIAFELNLRQGAFGGGLLGAGFIIYHLILLNTAIIPAGLNWLGFISGILMALGIPTGLFYGKEGYEMTTGTLDWKRANKLAIAAVLSTVIGQLGLIVWVFWLGIKIISV